MHFDKTDLELKSIFSIQNSLINIFKDTNFLFFPKHKNSINIHHANHHSGTMKMSVTKKLGVIDKNFQVHGLNNLFLIFS